MDLTPELCRAARGLLRLDQKELSEASGVPLPTIRAFETVRSVDGKPARRLTTMNNRALVEAFEKGGLEFIPENGGGEGIRFRMRKDGTRDDH
jgi:hypothetical protein